MKTMTLKTALALLLLLVLVLYAAPMTLAEEVTQEVPVQDAAQEAADDPAPAIPALEDVLAQTNPARSSSIAVSYDGLAEVYSGDTVTLIAKLSGYEGLSYSIYWQYLATSLVDGVEESAWMDEGLSGNTFSLLLSNASAATLRRFKVVITGVEGYETSGTVKDFSQERSAILGSLAVRPELPLVEEVPVTEVIPAVEIAAVPVARSVQIFTTLGNAVNQGEAVTMTGVLTGFDGVQVLLQWQVNDGSGWKDIQGATGTTYTYSADEQTVNSDWRLKVDISD
jgi:hypothetical protein